MDIVDAKKLSYESIRKLYKAYLQSQELGKNTIGTVTGDTFYLWNNGGKDLFWDTVTPQMVLKMLAEIIPLKMLRK